MTLEVVCVIFMHAKSGVKMDKNELVTFLLRRYRTLQTIRLKNEEKRWFAMALVNHRTDSSSLSPSPVPDIVRHSNVPQNAVDDFVNYFVGNLVSPNIPWLGMMYESNDLTPQDDMAGANDYMGAMRNRILSEFASTNFYPQHKLAVKDRITGGLSVMLVRSSAQPNATAEERRKAKTVYTTLAPWDCWVDTNQFGEYDTLFYKKRMTVMQAYEMFGEELPEWMKKILEDGDPFNTWHDFLLCIYPRNKVYKKKRALFSEDKDFAVIWMYLSSANASNTDSGKSEIITESGSDYFPVAIDCWDMDGDNPNGTSPVIRNSESLVRMDNLEYETMLSLQKLNHQPVSGVQASLETFSDDPGARNVVASPELEVKPFPVNQSLEGSMAMQDRQEKMIQKMFNNDIFNYLSQQEMNKVFTATQVNAVKAEQLSLLASVFGNFQSSTEKFVSLTILVMSEDGRLPKGAAEILKGDGKIKVTIESTLAQELRAYTNRDANIALLEQCAAFMSLQQNDALLNFDFDEMARGIAQGLGVDHKVLKDKMLVLQERQMIAQQQAQQNQLQAALTQSEINRNNAGASNYNNAGGANQYGGR